MKPLDDALLDKVSRRRLAALATAPTDGHTGPRDWYRIQNSADTDEVDVYIYDAIGGWWGVDAAQFVSELRSIKARRLNVHINSPGGSVFDGIAIFQALRNHSARIVTYVDSLAASAASFIAMAGDQRIVAPYGSLMIHDAWGLAIGNAADMQKLSEELDRLSGTIADIYANRSGVGDRDEWRTAMLAETWYSAQEAVEAGLAHEVQEDAEKDGGDSPAANRFDLSVFNYAGRADAPTPWLPRAVTARAEVTELPATAPTPTEGTEMSGAEPETTEPKEDPVSTLSTDVRSRLGLTEDADDAAILAALDAVKAKADTADRPDPSREAAIKAQADENAELRKEVDLLNRGMEQVTGELAAAKAERAAAAKKAVLDAAQAQGKFKSDERAQWDADYDEAPGAVTRMLDRIAAESAVPMSPVGHTGGDEETDDDWDAAMARLDGPTTASKGA